MSKEGILSTLLAKIKNLPDDAGVYRFIDESGTPIYIGKAKNLKKRVSSYFLEGKNQSYRIRLMVKKSVDLQFTITGNESEALLLENNLIKENQPRYNINLKDGKSYPFICIKNERFPRVFPTRKKVKDGSSYFGPYASVKIMQAMLDLIRQNFQVRTCNFLLSQENIHSHKFKTCLEFQIGNCGGPCEGLIEEKKYLEGIENIKKILNGNIHPILEQFKKDMHSASEKYEFEKAEKIKRRIERLTDYRKRSTIFSEKLEDMEAIVLLGNATLAVVTHFRIRNGTIVQTHAFEIVKKEGDEDAEILLAAISRLLTEEENFAKEWITNITVDPEEIPHNIQLLVPQRADKKKLIDLGLRNCKNLMEEKTFRNADLKRPINAEALTELQKHLRLEKLPMHIECFDNSNIQGTSPVASLVVFKNGLPAKKDYRHFKIKTVEGPNDFASMEEVVFRRYKRLLDENAPLPDLIMVDGGKGQLSSAVKSMEALNLLGKIPIIGIAKRLEEIYRVNDPVPLHIDKRSPGLKLLQQLRNEAHRFAITFHRETRAKASGGTSLEKIEGIGPATAKKILKHFKSVKKMKAADAFERIELLGEKLNETLEAAIKKGEL